MASQSVGYQITKRKKNGQELGPWQLRVFVPKALQPSVGKTEVWRSLQTPDRRLAERLVHSKLVEIESEWPSSQLDTPSDAPPIAPSVAPSELAMMGAATTCAFDVIEESMAQSKRRADAMSDSAAYAEYLDALRNRMLDLVRTRRAAARPSFEGIADKHIQAVGWHLPKPSPAYELFVDMIAEAVIDALKVTLERDSGNLAAEPTSPVVKAGKQALAAKAKPGETLLELFDLWAEEMLAKGAKRADTVNQDRKVIAQVAAFIGTDRDVRSITPMDVADYRDTMRQLPPKWMSKKALRDLDMLTAAARARELDMPRTAFTNVNKHLSTISPLFKWLAGQPKWAGLGNPCAGLFYPKVKGKNPRPPFTTGDLNAILGSPLFTGFQGDGKEHLPGNQRARDWRHWIPLVAMFTGARIGEVAQLRLGDVRQERGVWFVHIRHDAGEGLATKSGKSRPAAVHSLLEDIGFLEFHARQCERAGSNPGTVLFPELAPNARGQISGTPSRWWRDYLAAIGVKDPSVEGGDGFGSHSFRHTLADRLRDEAELLDTEIAVCLGHSIKTTTSGYGRLTQGTVSKFKGWMDAVTFEGVKLDHLQEGA
jgi:integrase